MDVTHPWDHEEEEEIEDVATGALPRAMVGTDVNVASVSLNPSMKPTLQRFCDSTSNPVEKARALELLTALEMSSAIKAEQAREARPKTAAPRLQSVVQQPQQMVQMPAPDFDVFGNVVGGSSGSLSYTNSYETSHNYFFQPPVPSPSRAVRPASSQIQRVVPPARELPPGNSFADLFMTTTYGREFFAKSDEARRPAPERAASARGVRNNNPHPNKEFLVWRYRRPMTATEKIELATLDSQTSPEPAQQRQNQQLHPQLTNESFDRAVRGKYRSTYKHDYLGVPTTFDPSLLSVEGRSAPAYDRSSMSRGAFAEPAQLPAELSVTKARFGQNPAQASPGVLPAGGLMSRQTLGARTRTTYEAHISEPASRFMRVTDLRQLSNAQNAQAVARMLDVAAPGSERAALMKLYKEMQCRQLPASIPLPVERRIYKERVGGHMRAGVTQQPVWVSTWNGPA